MIDNAATLRMKAAIFRSQAEETTQEKYKVKLLNLAELYDYRARLLDGNGAQRKAKDDDQPHGRGARHSTSNEEG